MVRIDGLSRVGVARRTTGRAGQSYTSATAARAAAEPAAAPAPAMLDAMLALQEAGAAEADHEETARGQAKALLAAMDSLQHSLLRDADDLESLRGLAALTRRLVVSVDPELAALVQGVALRARVELARRGLPDS
jgi:hypothetical protein